MIFTLLASSFGGDLPVELFIEWLLPLFFGLFFSFYLIYAICFWQIFKKAGKTSWLSFIPIINIFVLLDIIEKPKYWFVALYIPIINYVVLFLIFIELAQRFEKSTGFGVGMVLLPFIFLPMLAFGDAQLKEQKEIFYDDGVLDRG